MTDIMVNQAGTWPERVKELEAEVDRLRAEVGVLDTAHHKAIGEIVRLVYRLDAYRAAVAEMRKALGNDCGDIGVSTRAVLLAFLDKLPSDET